AASRSCDGIEPCPGPIADPERGGGWTAVHTSITGGCHPGAVSSDAGTIVVVEDDPNIADLVDLYLRREGFRVLQAGDGERGLEVVDRERPKLVVLDVGLPGRVDGLEVCRRIRSRRQTAGLLLTARDG